MERPTHWKGFLYIAAVTIAAVLVVEPLVEKAVVAVTGRTAENLLTFGKAA